MKKYDDIPKKSVFAKIADGEIDEPMVHRGRRVVAFLPKDSIKSSEGNHVLVAPKRQVDEIYDPKLPLIDVFAMAYIALKVSRRIKQRSGIRALWGVSGYEIPHAHIHVYAGKRGDPMLSPGVELEHLSDDERAKIASELYIPTIKEKICKFFAENKLVSRLCGQNKN